MPRKSMSQAARKADLLQQLQSRFPQVPPATVRRLVNHEWRTFSGASVTTYVPVLVERRSLAALRRLTDDQVV